MALTGVFILPIAPGQSSPSSALISHISRSFPAEPLPSFHLDYRLFVDTSSLLPGSDTSQRKSASILTLSHTPFKTYVATSPPKDKSQPTDQPTTFTVVTVPSSSADPFTQLIGTKFQPQWAHRQSMIVDSGTALSLENGQWVIRIGDLKTPSRQTQTGSNLRGMVVEVSFIEQPQLDATRSASQGLLDDAAALKDVTAKGVSKEDETLLRGFLDSVTDGSGVPSIYSVENARSLIRRTKLYGKDKDTSDASPDWDLANLYLDVLRGPRG
ncbi:uncharacterized protein Z520_11643 [Fonsecaea multimorphosa CBS 102226]|uniref:Mediator of RNA polymerase II transcription subunit 20 n=1 Tax=Fonsecaea multimorphosa CBS 102226 TaxID=1442371 RepID=A0A0D2JQ30_9EURO|nr:uncharacterized protein Z520_11643 [Fonsecaea multimorphosa CBS 102226]KIX92614.1 hypothetical protein Z520_11643 [Fonsecaea multimorphosa CBS 102226]OAL17917.1 hypothetical protein AYO22_11181 [Fonsecaea multimorphosa]